MPELDVLTFVDEPYSYFGLPGVRQVHNSRRLTINGVQFSEQLSAVLGEEVDVFTPLIDGGPAFESGEAYLRSLMGGLPPDGLRAGRVAVGYCGACLDSSCGIMAAVSLRVTQKTVSWSEIGMEREHFGEFVSIARRFMPPFRASIDPPEWWTPDPVSPPFTFTFDRVQYFEAIDRELARRIRRE